MFNKRFYEENKIQLTSYLEVPKYYLNHKNRIRETCFLRDQKFKNLQNGIIESPYEEEFYRIHGSYFDREIILFLEDRDQWKFWLQSKNVQDKDAYNKSYISLDFFNSNSSLGIEIDSIGNHSGKEEEDFARDMYLLNVFGITTLRFYYDSFKGAERLIQEKLRDGKPIGYISFPRTSEILFDYQYSLEFKLMEKVYFYESIMKYSGRKGLILTLKDLATLKISLQDINKLRQFCKRYYQQDIDIIPNSQDYTLKEAFRVINDIESGIKHNSNIPDWIKIIEKTLKNKNSKISNVKFGIKELLGAIYRYGYTWEERLLIT